MIFCFVAFSNNLNSSQIANMVLSLTLIKVLYEILVMPVTVKLVGYLKHRESRDAFEKPTLKRLIPFYK